MLRTAVTRLLGFGYGRRASVSTAAAAAAAAERGYHERAFGLFYTKNHSFGMGIVRDLKCVYMTKLKIMVEDATGKIVDACHETVGGRIDHESSSVVTEWVKGKNLEEVMSVKTSELSKYLYQPPGKVSPLMLQFTLSKGPDGLDSLRNAEDAIKDAEFAVKAAVEDYKANKVKATAENSWNFGLFDENDSSVGTGAAFVYHDHCHVKFQIKVVGEIISDVRYKASGCEVAIASSSLASEIIRGKKLKEAINFANWEILFATMTIIKFLRVPPTKFQCVLAPIAIRGAVLDYISKK